MNPSDDPNYFVARIAELEGMLRARDRKITELGNLINLRRPSDQPSKFKGLLVQLWDGMPRKVQKKIEPLADFIDKIVK